eukprot:jgi/Botrbrau1/2927/Bobra.0026s0004.1
MRRSFARKMPSSDLVSPGNKLPQVLRRRIAESERHKAGNCNQNVIRC